MQEGGSWQGVLRALYAVEAIVQQGSTAACGEVAVHFQVEAHFAEQDNESMSIRGAMVYTLCCHTVLDPHAAICTHDVLEVCLKSCSWWKKPCTQTEAHLTRQAPPWLQHLCMAAGRHAA